MAFLKWIGVSIAILLLLFITTLFCITTFIDPNRFTGRLCQEINKQTGQEVAIGHLSWGFFPHIRIKGDNITLRNPALENMLFASADSLSLEVKILPLLYKHIECENIQLNKVAFDVNPLHPVHELLKTVEFNVKGWGEVDLIQHQINMHLQGTPTDKEGDWGNRFIPMDVTGSLKDPTVHVDWTVLTQYFSEKRIDLLKARIEKTAEKWLNQYKKL